MHPHRRRRRFAPLWVYFFGMFAVAVLQRLVLAPEDHGVAFNVAVFGAGAAIVVAVLTVLERNVEH